MSSHSRPGNIMRHDRRKFLGLAGAFSLATLTSAPMGRSAERQYRTRIGVFNLDNASIGVALGAQAVRILITPAALADASTLSRLAGFKKAGITVIATMWESRGKGQQLPEVDSPEWNHRLDTLASFLLSAGSSIDFCTLSNEPTLEFRQDFHPDASGNVRVTEFFTAMARRARSVIAVHPALSHIRVTSPATFGFTNQRKMKQIAALNSVMLSWADLDPNIDAIDIHEHVANTKELDDDIRYVSQHTSKPFIITEWSQAPCAYSWIESSLDSNFARRWNVAGIRTNEEYVRRCYEKPVSQAEWNEFVAGAPYDSTFMARAAEVMDKHGIVAATYGQYRQYGAVRFDTKQLTASKTVVPDSSGMPQTNYKFEEWFQEMARSRSGR